jgi:Fe-S-cluster formation regulator IscX/YfhJ
MQEVYRALHEIARKISRRREIDLRFSPPTIELEDTRYVVTDLNGLRDLLSKIADDPNLSDSFNECYDVILEAILSCAVLPREE